MGPVPEASDSSNPAPTRPRGWLGRLPLWVRIGVPVVLIVGGLSIALVAVLRPSAPVEPVDAARSTCESGITAEIESHDAEVVEVSFFGVEASSDDVYLARGDAAYRDAEGEVHRVQVRCTVRFEGGAMRTPSIRFSEPINAG